jgi:hypothetical protein
VAPQKREAPEKNAATQKRAEAFGSSIAGFELTHFPKSPRQKPRQEFNDHR